MVLRAGRHSRARPDAPTAVDEALRDEQAVARAYDAHGAEVYRFVLRSLGDAGSAQDVVQETFLRAWRAGDRFDPSLGSLRTWLFSIARNAMIDHVRAAGVRPWQAALVDDPAAASPHPGDDPSERLLRGWIVEEALRRLSGEHRTAIVETYLKDRPYAEVAAEMDLPVGTLRSRVFYGLKALRVAMDEMGVEP